MRIGRQLGRLALATLAAATVITTTPLAAGACACGGFVGDQTVRVQRETAVVQLLPGREVVTMQFAATTAATRAAWVMPVPARAQFELGDPALFDQLELLSAPEYRDVYVERESDGGVGSGGAAPGDTGVTVTDHVEIGPYEVAQLAGSDPAAVATWLAEHGFTLPPALGTGLGTYLAENWSVVAVKMSATSGATLDGLMPPLRLSFDTAEPVYPMRLSGLAQTTQALRLYVLADHRIDVTGPAPQGGTLRVAFAGRNDPGKYAAIPASGAGPAFVTRFDGQWATPSVITEDVRFRQAAADDTYREVITRRHVVEPGEAPEGAEVVERAPWLTTNRMFALGGGVVILLAAGAVVLLVLRRRSAR